MDLKLVQFRCRSALRWPVAPDLNRTAGGATKSGKPNRDLAEKHGDDVLPIVLDLANTAAGGSELNKPMRQRAA